MPKVFLLTKNNYSGTFVREISSGSVHAYCVDKGIIWHWATLSLSITNSYSISFTLSENTLSWEVSNDAPNADYQFNLNNAKYSYTAIG